MLRLIALFGLIFGLPFVPAAYADTEIEPCTLTEDAALNWASIPEAQTLRIHIFNTGTFPAQGRYELIMEDGNIIDLGEGGKFIDHYHSGDDMTDCEYQLQGAGVTLAIKTGIYGRTDNSLARMSDFITGSTETEILTETPCDDIEADRSAFYDQPWPSREDQNAMDAHAQMRDDWDDRFLACERRRATQAAFKDTPTLLVRLTQENAPIIQVNRSAYGGDFLAYDRQTQSFHYVDYSGC